MTRAEPIHAVAWIAWATGAAVTVQLAPNPLYVALVVGVAAVVVQAHAVGSPLAKAFPLILSLGAVFGVTRVVLTAATVHGSGSALFTTPTFTLPRLLGGFAVGGAVNTAVVLQAAADAWVIVGLMAVFGAFNAIVSHYDLVRLAPRAFYELGLVVTVALAFVPTTVRSVQAVREADRARTGGRVVRRGRLLRLVVPILETGMERAVALAESMDARGFSRQTLAAGERVAGWCTLGALVALGGGFVALVGHAPALAVALEATGVAALCAAIMLSSGRARPRYRPVRMNGRDWGIVVVSVAVPLFFAVLSLSGNSTLKWAAPTLHVPRFDPVAGLAVLALAMPAVWPRSRVAEQPVLLAVGSEAT